MAIYGTEFTLSGSDVASDGRDLKIEALYRGFAEDDRTNTIDIITETREAHCLLSVVADDQADAQKVFESVLNAALTGADLDKAELTTHAPARQLMPA